MPIFRRAVVRCLVVAGLIASLTACSSSSSDGEEALTSSANRQTGTASTLDGAAVVTQQFRTPEALRDELVDAISSGDRDAAYAVWPSATWDTLGADVVGGFEPGPASSDCDRVSASAAHCVVFEHDWPRALELTMSLDAAGSWTITAISLESTN